MKRPWNLVNSPVYSLATYSGDTVNMNICTYVTAISRKPKMYSIALEERSTTYINLLKNKNCVLQILNEDHINLIRTLGKKSGKNYNKQNYLEKRNLLSQWQDHLVLKDVNALLLLEKKRKIKTGDHYLFIFDVLKSKTFQEEGILMFNELIVQNIIL